MSEELIPLTPNEQTHRNKLLRAKKRGMQLAVLILMLVSCGIIYLLQVYEQVNDTGLYVVTATITSILYIGILLYRRFARLINLDLQSSDKIVTTAIVVRTNFIGNTVYPTRIYGSDKTKYITLDVGGRWITLSGLQIKRLLPEVWQANRLYLRDQFLMEFTPHGRDLMRMEKL